MRKRILILVALLASTIFSGCTPKETATEMEKIQKQLNEMQGYECSLSMKRISNKGENTYEAKQYYKSTGEYRMDLTAPETVAGNYTIFDGNRVCQYNPRIAGVIVKDVAPSQQRNELFLGQFVKNYMQSEGVSVAAAAMGKADCTVLEAVIPGNDENLATEKLWVDNETLKPVQFVLYDKNGEERYVIEYHDFQYDPALDDKLFVIPE